MVEWVVRGLEELEVAFEEHRAVGNLDRMLTVQVVVGLVLQAVFEIRWTVLVEVVGVEDLMVVQRWVVGRILQKLERAMLDRTVDMWRGLLG